MIPIERCPVLHPALSELLGILAETGRRHPRAFRVRPCRGPRLGKAVPYVVDDIHPSLAGGSVGISHDTAEFAVAAIRRGEVPVFTSNHAPFFALAATAAIRSRPRT